MERQKPRLSVGDQSPDILKAYSGLLFSIADMIKQIEASHDIQRNTHEFHYEVSPETLITIPGVVRDVLPDADSLILTLTKEQANDFPMISVHFFGESGEVIVSRDGALSHSGDETPDLFIGANSEEVRQLEKVSEGAINELLMSVMFPREDRLYPSFEDKSLLQPLAFTTIREALAANAVKEVVTDEHTFSNSTATFFRSATDGQPDHFTVHYDDPKTNEPRSLEGNLSFDFQISFFKHQDNPEAYKQAFQPSASEIAQVQQVIHDESYIISPEVSVDGHDIYSHNDPAEITQQKQEYQEDILTNLDPDIN